MRSIAASIVGWIVVALIVWILFGWIIGTLLWVSRLLLVLVVIGGLIALYFKLKE